MMVPPRTPTLAASFTASLTALALVPGLAWLGASPAQAAPLPAAYAATAHGDLVGVDADVLDAGSLTGAAIGHSRATVSSTTTAGSSTAESANLDASVLFGGVPLPVDSETVTAPPTADPPARELLGVPLSPLADVGVATGDVEASWAGVDACVPASGGERVLSDSRTDLAGVTLASVPGFGTLADVGASELRTTTSLVDDAAGGADVVSVARTTVGDINLLGDNVTVDVDAPAELRATSDGTTGTADLVNPPTVTAVVGEESVPIPLNGTPVDVDVPLLPLADVTITGFSPTDLSSGPVGEAELQSLLRIQVEVAQLVGPPLASVDLSLAPMDVRAEAPSGGVECPADVVPAAPVITEPADGSTTQDATPTVSGSGATEGSTVTVRDADGRVVCTDTTVGADGLWSCTPADPLPDGDHTFTAEVSGPGGTSASSAPVDVTIDATAPAVSLDQPAPASSTNDPTPPVAGTAEPGATVDVTDEDGDLVCSTTASTQGTWTCTGSTPLDDGTHTFTATATDGAGNTATDTSTFTVDPAAPTVDITGPAQGSTTGDSTPTASGTAEAGASVAVTRDGGVPVCVTVAGDDGTWSCAGALPLEDGAHSFVATATDGTGNAASDATTFVVDTTAPEAPVITSPAEGTQVPDATPTITGRGEADSTVTVREGTTALCTAVVAADGTWSCTPVVPLGAGGHTVTATATDGAGNESGPATTSFTVVGAPADPGAPPGPGPGPDPDGDGLPTDQETTLGTDPADPDSDGDGLTDGREVTTTLTDPRDPDSDDDNLVDGREVRGMVIKERFEVCGRNKVKRQIRVTTDPLARDTDGDGLADGLEIKGYTIKQRIVFTRAGGTFTIGRTRSNPTRVDTDRDKLDDRQEMKGARNKKFKRRNTDPTKCDTDRGGASDGREVRRGSDPTRIKSGPNDVRRPRMQRSGYTAPGGD